mmetsp:Transcript_9851/g.28021  ORF Transcript_9851/g.28021 Transcript_9851/m.28021 type:complete len:209 (+) Transcript_9851:173-799(+)
MRQAQHLHQRIAPPHEYQQVGGDLRSQAVARGDPSGLHRQSHVQVIGGLAQATRTNCQQVVGRARVVHPSSGGEAHDAEEAQGRRRHHVLGRLAADVAQVPDDQRGADEVGQELRDNVWVGEMARHLRRQAAETQCQVRRAADDQHGGRALHERPVGLGAMPETHRISSAEHADGQDAVQALGVERQAAQQHRSGGGDCARGAAASGG